MGLPALSRCGYPYPLVHENVTAPWRVRPLSDDGVGGACASKGSGLRGLADRLNALGGTLSIDSPRGGPTRTHARVPRLPLG
jgi:hypothetical protein